MGKTITKIADPLGVTPLSKGGSGGNSSSSNFTPPDTSRLFDPYSKYIPQAMNSNQPINDPSAILQAYIQHMPEFRAAAEGSSGLIPPVGNVKSQKQGK